MTLSRDIRTRWRQVRARRVSSGDAFVYAVVSTGIYCRPDCPARRPKRANVRFFDGPADAEAAGFRACLRCRPAEGRGFRHQAAIVHACEVIETREPAPGLDELARTAGLSVGHFQRLFKREVGLSPKQYAIAMRKRRLRDALPAAASVTEAIYRAGYSTSSRAYTDGHALGMRPQRYLHGGRDERIRFAEAESSLGRLLVAATDRGICMIEFGEIGALLAALRERFPAAVIEPGGAALERHIADIVRLIDQPEIPVALPLDIRGTAFQEKVWRALTDIPVGKTASYADVARAIGRPRAARAVARACAANRLAVAVPCHRVVRGDGDPSGYRWGLERKRRLLAREAGADTDET